MRPFQVFALFGAVFFAHNVFSACPSNKVLVNVGSGPSQGYVYENAFGSNPVQVIVDITGLSSNTIPSNWVVDALHSSFPNSVNFTMTFGANCKMYVSGVLGSYTCRLDTASCAPETDPEPTQEEICNDRAGSSYIGTQGASAGCAPDGCAYAPVSSTNGALTLGSHTIYGTGATVYQATGSTCEGYDGYIAPIGPVSSDGGPDGCVKISDDSMVCDDSSGVEGMPEGCMAVVRDSGTTFTCGTDNPDTGNPDAVCGWVGDSYNCVSKGTCEYISGSTTCVDESGNYVGTDSPDNPQNGGNLDGNVYNDVMAPGSMPNSPAVSNSTVAENKQSAGEVANLINPKLDMIGGKIDTTNEKLAQLNDMLNSGPSGQNLPTGSDYTRDTEVSAFFSSLDASLGDPSSPAEYGDSMMGDSGNSLLQAAGLNISNNCQELSFPIFHEYSLNFSCSLMTKTQSILAWVFWIYTLYSVISIGFSTINNRES